MFGLGKAELLQRIAERGSAAAAGRLVAMSREHVGQSMADIDAVIREPRVERARS